MFPYTGRMVSVRMRVGERKGGKRK